MPRLCCFSNAHRDVHQPFSRSDWRFRSTFHPFSNQQYCYPLLARIRCGDSKLIGLDDTLLGEWLSNIFYVPFEENISGKGPSRIGGIAEVVYYDETTGAQTNNARGT